MKRITGMAVAALLVVPSIAAAQECPATATIGDFEVTYEGAAFDGFDTQLTYCITGLGGPGFKALSNWGLDLPIACVNPGDISDCSTADCYPEKDDPNLGITGIKFDEEEVEAGETKCYDFSLEGDWTGAIGDALLAIKAGPEVHSGVICGPICVACEVDLFAWWDETSGHAMLKVDLVHNKPIAVETSATYRVVRSDGERIVTWSDAPFLFTLGSRYLYETEIPGPSLGPGDYEVIMRLRGMNGWIERRVPLTVPAP